jgi:hypothetical protein
MLRQGSDSSRRSGLFAAAPLVLAALITAFTPPECAASGERAFDAARAFSYLEAQDAFGPRAPGFEGRGPALDYLCGFFAKRGAHVDRQSFALEIAGSTFVATNVVAAFHRRIQPRVLLCAHWDTRPWADGDPDSSRHEEPVPGANDGASGVAVLMEVANALAERTPLCGVDIVLFDAEDMGGRHGLDYALGSKHYASVMTEPPAAVILIDLVGDAELDLPVERYSLDHSPGLVGAVWGAAERLGLSQFGSKPHSYVYDDHVPFLLAGIPAVDIVDIEYEHWHTVSDTPDKCSPESLKAVGTLILHLLYDPGSPLPPFLEGDRP